MNQKRIALILLCYSLLSFVPIVAQNVDLLKRAIPYRKGNLWGFANPETKQVLVPPVYDSVAYPMFANLPPLVYKNGTCGLFAFYKSKNSLEELIPLGQEHIYKTFRGDYIVKNERGIQFVSAKGIPLLEGNFESFVNNEQLVFHRGNNKPDVLWDQNAVLVDSVFKINKIPNDRDWYEIKRNIMPALAFEHKSKIDLPDDGKVYVTTSPPKTHDDIYDFVFSNPKGEMYVLTKKSKKFILIEAVDFPKYTSDFPKHKAIFQLPICTTPLNRKDWQTDDTQNDKVFKSNNKVKFKTTNQFFKNIRLCQNKDNTRFGLIQNVFFNQHLAVILPPIYKQIKIHQYPYTQEDFVLELELENGTKQLFRNNEIMDIEPIDSFLFYFDCIITAKNGLKGIGFLDFETRTYTFLSPKYKEILVDNQRDVDFKKVILPNDVYYYVSKKGFEFYEE